MGGRGCWFSLPQNTMNRFSTGKFSSNAMTPNSPPLIAIDIETGGVFPSINPLLSVSIVPEWTMEPFTVYIEPLALEVITPEAAKKNGYTLQKWLERGALPLRKAMLQLNDNLQELKESHPKAIFVAHNSAFDAPFLNEAYRQADLPQIIRYNWRCSLQLMAQRMDDGLIPEGKLSLDRLGELAGIWPIGGRPLVHEAHEDALACLKGYRWLKSLSDTAV